jgi:hypothetical protein
MAVAGERVFQLSENFYTALALEEEQLLSPLRTDSRQLVSKIYWRRTANNGIMREPEWREPTGFV